MQVTREWIEDWLGAFGFHTCVGPAQAYFEYQPHNAWESLRFTYDVVAIGGVKQEGQSTGIVATTKERAALEFLYELGKYVLSHGVPGDTVVWRRFPETSSISYEDSFAWATNNYYTTNCRLTVVAGKVTKEQLEAANEPKESEENTAATAIR